MHFHTHTQMFRPYHNYVQKHALMSQKRIMSVENLQLASSVVLLSYTSSRRVNRVPSHFLQLPLWHKCETVQAGRGPFS